MKEGLPTKQRRAKLEKAITWIDDGVTMLKKPGFGLADAYDSFQIAKRFIKEVLDEQEKPNGQ